MAIDKLIPMTEFVLLECRNMPQSGQVHTLFNIYNYANFLRQTLTFEMFIGEEALFEGFESDFNGAYNRKHDLTIEPHVIDWGTIEDAINILEGLTLTQKAKDIIYRG